MKRPSIESLIRAMTPAQKWEWLVNSSARTVAFSNSSYSIASPDDWDAVVGAEFYAARKNKREGRRKEDYG